MIHVIINPAAGRDIPVLATINDVFQPAGIPWRVSITQKAGDAKAQAEAAVKDGVDVVAVYGGDGTVVEAASGLINSNVPLAILPGGTANVVAQEMTIPQNLAAACKVATGQRTWIRQVDIGKANEVYFLLRVGLGTEARIIEGADREAKNRLGFLAYLWSAAQSLSAVEQATYHLMIDGNAIEVDGITCAIINSGNLGIGNLHIAQDVRMDDGLLDVIVVQNVNLPAIAELIGSVIGFTPGTVIPFEQQTPKSNKFVDLDKYLLHWQGKCISVRATPPQIVQYDGELMPTKEVNCQVFPNALQVVVPRRL